MSCWLCERPLAEIATYYWSHRGQTVCAECHLFFRGAGDEPVWFLGEEAHQIWLRDNNGKHDNKEFKTRDEWR